MKKKGGSLIQIVIPIMQDLFWASHFINTIRLPLFFLLPFSLVTLCLLDADSFCGKCLKRELPVKYNSLKKIKDLSVVLVNTLHSLYSLKYEHGPHHKSCLKHTGNPFYLQTPWFYTPKGNIWPCSAMFEITAFLYSVGSCYPRFFFSYTEQCCCTCVYLFAFFFYVNLYPFYLKYLIRKWNHY